MFNNLFKIRSPFGKFLDKLNREHNITQGNFAQMAKVNPNTISRCANSNARPNQKNGKKIMRAARKLDPNIKDFWHYID